MARGRCNGLVPVEKTVKHGGRANGVGAISAWLRLLVREPFLDNNKAPYSICLGITTPPHWERSVNTGQPPA